MDKLQTGDLILFHGENSIISSIIEGYTNSKWSHVGIVLRNPTYIDKELTGLYLWESGKETFKDSEDKKYKYGVQITDLEKVVNEYDGIVVFRKLVCNKTSFPELLKTIHNTIHNKPYDLDIFDFIMAKLGITCLDKGKYKYSIFNWFGYNPQKLDKLYCSSLVAYVYTELGLLPKDTRWTDIFPYYFSSENTKLKLIDAKLCQEEYLTL